MLGHLFTSLSFASALVATLALLWRETRPESEKREWARMGGIAFSVHMLSVLGIIGFLFGLIATHNYEYHYVWAHSSNELPVYYMISCFWEGQEGSFLLWSFWHSVLGMILLWKGPKKWKYLSLGVIASIELVLSSMILGAYVPEIGVYIILGLLLVAPALYLFMTDRNALDKRGDEALRTGGIALAAIGLCTLVLGKQGFGDPWRIGNIFDSADSLIFALPMLAMWAFVFYCFWQMGSKERKLGEIIAGLVISAAAFSVFFFDIETWKIGSTPFLLLKEAFPNNDVYAANPDFVPTNGNGLNSLLQNYWMVIHPPTLFLGFAATAVPFAFVMAGLIRGDFKGWIKPAMPWIIFSVMILGVGIIMGGYWAYETLNFGGYWNWDPVENGSLVPWIVGVASLHALLLHQKSKGSLKTSMILVIGTFFLVLYATFLTRSGILGDTSVHTFTDLGLSGQLILLVAIYFFASTAAMIWRWKEIPTSDSDPKLFSAENMLFLGILILLFSSAEILITTSLPVFNKIFGSSVAPPPERSFFYYKWNVWIAIGFGVLAALGQFLWWKLGKKKKLADALFRPFLIAVLLGSALTVTALTNDMNFVYDAAFAEERETGFLGMISGTVLGLADELMLFTSLFIIIAGLDVIFSMVVVKKAKLKTMGGSLAHIGFGLMLVGMLYSSGYDRIISQNITPDELAGFSNEQERMDNVRLVKDFPRFIPGYQVTYLGKKEAVGPIHSLKVIEETAEFFKVRFRDATNDEFGLALPRDVFLETDEGEATVHPTSDVVAASQGPLEGKLDMAYVEEFINKNLELLKPPHINDRTLYGLLFEPLKRSEVAGRDTVLVDTSAAFTLYPEVEVNAEMRSIIAHPARKVYLNSDLYVHVSQVPAEETAEDQFKYHDFKLKQGDTTYIGKNKLFLHSMTNLLRERPELANDFEAVVAANVFVIRGPDTALVRPSFLIDKEGKISMTQAAAERMFLDLALIKIDPESEVFTFQAQEKTNPYNDFVVIKAIRKPWINVLWLGTFVLGAGFLLAIYRRVS